MEDISEEFVVEILERTKTQPIERLETQRTVVRGDVNLAVINEALALSIPEGDEHQTVGGFVLDQAGRVPDEGDEIHYEDLVIRVLQTDGRQIERLLLVRSSSEH